MIVEELSRIFHYCQRGGSCHGFDRKERSAQKQQLNVRLSLEVLEMLASYCRFIGGGKTYVVEECLRYTFGHDQSFQEWLSHNRTTRIERKGGHDGS